MDSENRTLNSNFINVSMNMFLNSRIYSCNLLDLISISVAMMKKKSVDPEIITITSSWKATDNTVKMN